MRKKTQLCSIDIKKLRRFEGIGQRITGERVARAARDDRRWLVLPLRGLCQDLPAARARAPQDPALHAQDQWPSGTLNGPMPSPLSDDDQRAAALSAWLHRYNWHRPHGGIKSHTPISRLGLSEDNLLRLQG